MNNELPFELDKNHKYSTKFRWKRLGLKITAEEFERIYNKYIYSTNCELCNKEFKNTIDRQMEHSHDTGEYRNIVCNRCNLRKKDVKLNSNNTSGCSGIFKHKDKSCKQGYIWVFYAMINGKQKHIKSSVDKEKLIEYAEKWKQDNNYHT